GADQYRGWFQSSLLTSVGALDQGAPFRQVLTHGWVVDGQGRAMHKSLGNGVDPADLIKEFGADIVRLWAASSDYHADVRCSKEIFKQLSQNYLKFRNTARYCLGNLDGFDSNNLVAAADMEELDRWAISRLNVLIERCFKSYKEYDFSTITHAINDFCVVEMSNFYLDIIKDRLYCEGKDSQLRRSAQTAMYLILDTMTKIMAPILCFTCDEIWLAMPHAEGADTRNVLFNEMNPVFTEYALDEASMAKWNKIIAIRDVVNVALEAARAEKKIGKGLEANVALTVTAEEAFLAEMEPQALADLFIISQVTVTVGEAVSAAVEPAAGEKCQRCWKVLPTVNAEGLCPRCASVVKSFI
ncbi:MAG: class I tRNA ligase family protein, partial [Ruminiclostridium sp.]|nr:class I tRNA ligase family protein [Ruminiclostridium sp.]